ncbi:MAG: hypothetical protein JXP34_24165 [Planctomycetes bacterium]|nr:hypothetical protein [Planctomycetota bacterium]
MAKKTYSLIDGADLAREFVPMVLSVQGLLNREGPEVYIVSESRRAAERNWIEWYKSYGLQPLRAGLDFLLARVAEIAKGGVVYDPSVPESVNAAIVLAGLEDRVAIPPDFEPRIRAAGLGDIVPLAGRFSDRMAVSRWAVSQLLPRANRSVLGSFEVDEWTPHAPAMDLIVAERGFAMGLSMNRPDLPDEADLWDRVLSAAGPHAALFGWHTEADTEPNYVATAGKRGVHVLDGQPYNLSFHRHVAARSTFRPGAPPAVAEDAHAAYVTFILAPGETLQAVSDVQRGYWRSPRRGEVPLGWMMPPAIARLAPGILEYYHETRTPQDALLAGPSGIGRAYLTGFADPDGFLARTREAMDASALSVLAVLNRSVEALPELKVEHRLRDRTRVYSKDDLEGSGGEKDEYGTDLVDLDVAARYAKGLPDCLGFFQGWDPIPGVVPFLVEGKPWAPVTLLVGGDVKEERARFEKIAAASRRPLFIVAYVNGYECDMEGLVLLYRSLEEKGFTIVRPDTFMAVLGRCIVAEEHAAARIPIDRVLGRAVPDGDATEP